MPPSAARRAHSKQGDAVVYAASMTGRSSGTGRVPLRQRARLLALLALCACTEPLYSVDGGGEAGQLPSPNSDASAEAGSSNGPPAGSEAGLCEGASCGDAGPSDARVFDQDGGAEPLATEIDSGLDPVRSIWAGRYATRSFLYSYDGLVESTARFLTLAEIKPLPDGGLVLEEELCMWEGGWTFIIVSQLRLIYPGTKTSTVLTFDEQTFESKESKALIGYDAAPSGCTSGVTTVAAQPEQVWTTNSTCDCPRNTEVPSSPRDCRLTDTDSDKKPGFTFNVTIGSSRFNYYVTQEERLRLLNGYQVEGRLFAEREFLERTRVVGCSVDGVAKRIEDCPLGGGMNCPAAHNKAELVKIKADIGCKEIIQREEGLFSPLRPAFPAACASQLGI